MADNLNNDAVCYAIIGRAKAEQFEEGSLITSLTYLLLILFITSSEVIVEHCSTSKLILITLIGFR